MTVSARGLSPVKRESRPASTAQRLPTICLLGGDNENDSTATLRLQRLQPLGIVGSRAKTLALLIWNADGGNDRIGGVA